MVIVKSIFVLGILGLGVGIILGIAYTWLAQKKEDQEERIAAALPGLNCGVCGFPSCAIYAHNVALGQAEPDLCLAGGEELVETLAAILGRPIKPAGPQLAAVRCKGGISDAVERYSYDGPHDCRSNYILLGGNKACRYGCLGFGHCVGVCPYKAIKMGPERIPIIDPKACTGCGICVKDCPRRVIELIPKTQLIYLACRTEDKGKEVKKVCKKGCITCAVCVEVCPYEGAISIDPGPHGHKGNIPTIHYEKCTSCGICRAKCPTDSFVDRVKVRPYAIISLNCDGCEECVKVCEMDAIEGKPGKKHIVTKEKCIGCGRCFAVCPIRAITVAGALGYAKAI